MASCCRHDHTPAPQKQAAETAPQGKKLHACGHGHDHSHDHGHDHEHGHAAEAEADDGARGSLPALQFLIEEMDCPTEAKLISKAVSGLPAVAGLRYNFIERVLIVEHDGASADAIVAAIAGVGMKSSLREAGAVTPPPPARRPSPWPLVASGVLAAASEGAVWLSGAELGWASGALALASIAIGGRATLAKGWVALKTRTLNIHFLMALAVTGALAIGQWPEAAMVLFLFALAERLEAMSLARAGEAVRALMALSPDVARVADGDGWVERPVAGVAVGSRVLVRAGERVPLDGDIVSGYSAFNEAPITGESLPRDKGPGDAVFAGAINGNAVVEVVTTKLASGSVLARIIATVRDAQASRAPVQRFIDRFAAVYTPVVVALAVAFAVAMPLLGLMPWRESVYTALVLLVIACPCALVIATPVTLVSALAAAARHGMLVKGGAPLEVASRVAVVAFDKTGTLTRGEPALTGVDALTTVDADRALALAAALDAHSTHPLARAVLDAAASRGVDVPQADGLQERPGRGVEGVVDGVRYALGSRRMADEAGALDEALRQRLDAVEEGGEGTMLLLSGNTLLAVLRVADQVRAEARDALAALHAAGVKTVMLSGDNPHVVAAVARRLGVDEARGGLLPEDKLAAITQLQSRHGAVAMVGDGVNDAPALARADLGVAMGVAGSDSALETAGVALMDDRLEKLAALIRHARRTSRVLGFNIAVALGIKALFFVLALAGVTSLWMAVFADMGASLIVIGNGLRLARALDEGQAAPVADKPEVAHA